MEEIQNQIETEIKTIANTKVGPVTLETLLSAAIALVISFVIIHVLTALVHRAFAKVSKQSSALGGFMESAVKVILWILAILIIAEILGIPTSSLLAGVGVVGLALSLSIQNIISHLFSGITLLITRPFKAGDYIDVSGKTGIVDRVGLFYTTLTTLDNVRINIPNGDVTSAALTNFSGHPIRRVEQYFTTSYDTPTEAVKAAILEAARGDARILTDPAPFVSIKEYKESSIEYSSRVWCKGKDYWDVYFGMNERVRETFAKHGVTMTYNHLNVHLDR